MRLAISQLPREPRFPSLGYATLTRDYAIPPVLGRSYWPMLAMLSLPYTGYAHAILCWCFILAYSDSNTVYTFSFPVSITFLVYSEGLIFLYIGRYKTLYLSTSTTGAARDWLEISSSDDDSDSEP